MHINTKETIFIILFFIIGSTIATIVNRAIYRYYNDIPFFGIKSFCPKCQEFYKWYDDLPVIGYVLQLGRCRHCHERLDFYRFIIELLSGILFSFLYIKYNISFELLFYCLLNILILIIYSTFRRNNSISDFSITMFSIYVTLYSLDMIVNKHDSFNLHFEGFIISLFLIIIIKIILSNMYFSNIIDFNQCVFIALFGFLLGFRHLIVSVFIALLIGVLCEIINYNNREKNYKIPFMLYIIIGMSVSFFFSDEIAKLLYILV